MVLPGDAAASAAPRRPGRRGSSAPGRPPPRRDSPRRRRHARRRRRATRSRAPRRARSPPRLRRRGLLTFAEPNAIARSRQPARSPTTRSARRAAGATRASSPRSSRRPSRRRARCSRSSTPKADVGHPEFAGGNVRRCLGGRAAWRSATAPRRSASPSRRSTASASSAPIPGARAINVAAAGRAASAARTRRAASAARSRAGASVINMSYGSAALLPRGVRGAAARHAPRHHARRRRRQRAPATATRYEFPASLPHVLTVGALAAGRPAGVLLQRQRRAGPRRARASGIIAPTPAARRDDDRGRLRDRRRHELLAPIVAGGRRLGAHRAPGADRRPGRPACCALTADGHRRARATTPRRATGGSTCAAALDQHAAGGRPARAQRGLPLRRRPRVRPAGRADLDAAASTTSLTRAAGPLRGPGRRLPHARPRRAAASRSPIRADFGNPDLERLRAAAARTVASAPRPDRGAPRAPGTRTRPRRASATRGTKTRTALRRRSTSAAAAAADSALRRCTVR